MRVRKKGKSLAMEEALEEEAMRRSEIAAGEKSFSDSESDEEEAFERSVMVEQTQGTASIPAEQSLRKRLASPTEERVKKKRAPRQLNKFICLCRRCKGKEVLGSTYDRHKSNDTHLLSMLLWENTSLDDERFEQLRYLESYDQMLKDYQLSGDKKQVQELELKEDAVEVDNTDSQQLHFKIAKTVLQELAKISPQLRQTTPHTPKQVPELDSNEEQDLARTSSQLRQATKQAPKSNEEQGLAGARNSQQRRQTTSDAPAECSVTEEGTVTPQLESGDQGRSSKLNQTPLHTPTPNESVQAQFCPAQESTQKVTTPRTHGMSVLEMQTQALQLLGMKDVNAMYSLFGKSVLALHCYDASPNGMMQELVEWGLATGKLVR